MSKKKEIRKIKPKQIQKVFEENQSEKNNTLIIGGVIIAMGSIGLLVFVLSEKIFHVS